MSAAEDLIQWALDPARRAERLRQKVERTDPWRWYCRLCGAAGETPTRNENYAAAEAHLVESQCGSHAIRGSAESGHLLHVWSYG